MASDQSFIEHVADQAGLGRALSWRHTLVPDRRRPQQAAALVKEAAFLITGEGRTDFQMAFGNVPVCVARCPTPAA